MENKYSIHIKALTSFNLDFFQPHLVIYIFIMGVSDCYKVLSIL